MNTSVCWFCERELPDAGATLKKSLYSVVERRSAVVVRQVKYSILPIAVPRCTRCAKLHRRARIAFRAFLITGLVFGLPFAAPGLITLGGIGYLIGKGIEKWIYRSNLIKPMSKKSLTKHPLLSDKLAAGWTLTKPTA